MQINYRNIVLIEKYNMNNKTGFAIAAIAIVAALLVTTSAMNPSNAFAGGHYKKRTTQTLAQANECGNGTMALKVDCQNAASQIQGRHNAAAVSAAQGSDFGGNGGGHHDGKDGSHDGKDGSHDGKDGSHDGKDGSHDGKDGSGHDDYGQMSVGIE
jgi:hypothetical protein